METLEKRIQELTIEKIRQQAVRGEADRKVSIIDTVIAELTALMNQPEGDSNGSGA